MPNFTALARTENTRRERDAEVYRAYKRTRDLFPGATDRQLYNLVAVLPAPSYFLDAETCAKFLGVLLRGGDLSDMPFHRRSRYYSLYTLYARMRSEGRVAGRAVADVAEELVAMPAPSFWLSPRMIREIVARERAEEKRRFCEKAL